MDDGDEKTVAKLVLARFIAAGDVVPFRGKAVKNPHTIKIHGEKYFLSDDGGPLGTSEEQAEWAGEARVILGPGTGKFKYLWAYDTDRQMVAMWRAHDGNEKVWGSASSMQQKLVKLDKKGQLNRVDHAAFAAIEREMEKAARENLEALKRYIAENESDFQKRVNELTQEYFDRHVRPDIERAVAAVQSGVIPLGFKPFGGPEADRERQMTTKAMSDIMSRKFTEAIVDRFIRAEGLDPEGPGGDIQAAQWAVNDVVSAAYDEYLPERAGQS